MKQCKYCLEFYSEKDFGVAKTTPRKVYRRRKCRHCYRETKRKLLAKYREFIDKYKRDKGCRMCGVVDHRVLYFHHPGEKNFTIAVFYHHHFGLNRLIKEMEKCIVICANCHRIEHFVERQKKNGV